MKKMRLWLKFGIAGILIYSALLTWALITYPKLDNLAVVYTPWLLSGLTNINFYDPAITHRAVFAIWALINYAAIFGIFAILGLIATSTLRKTMGKNIMKYSIDTIDLPALVGIDPETNTVEAIRPIAPGEISQIEDARKLFSVVSPIMAMFAILHWNYQDIQGFTDSLSKGYNGPPPAPLTANRLLLNYIASADALLDHFGKTYKRQCRIKKMEDSGFDDLRHHLEETDDDFEFFTHFRKYIIHSALPVGNLTVTDSLGTGRTWSITYRSADLSLDKRSPLSSCRILAKSETIDLIHHLNQFHNLMMTRILDEIVKCFLVNLKETSQFHKTLAQEVSNQSPKLRPHLMTFRKQEGGRFKWTFDVLPRDLIAEFGIKLNNDQ